MKQFCVNITILGGVGVPSYNGVVRVLENNDSATREEIISKAIREVRRNGFENVPDRRFRVNAVTEIEAA